MALLYPASSSDVDGTCLYTFFRATSMTTYHWVPQSSAGHLSFIIETTVKCAATAETVMPMEFMHTTGPAVPTPWNNSLDH
eukprot:COSAG02_NODE_2173_length_9590_cov_39.075229_4_plen_81_part_00